MAELVKKTAVVCLTEEEFYETVGFREIEGVHEFFHITTIAELSAMDYVTNVIYRQSARELSEFVEISEAVNDRRVSVRWQ